MPVNKPLVTFHLGGRLGELHGKEHQFAVSSVPEGIRAMSYQFKRGENTPSFYEQISKGRYKILRDGREIGLEELHIGLGKTKEVHIIPEPAGEGGDGSAKFLLGLLIVAGSFIAAGPLGFGVGIEGGFAFAGATAPLLTFKTIAVTGALIAASGAAQMLSPIPAAVDTRTQERPEERPSFLIHNVTNTTEEGGPVPVIHGTEVLVGSHVISAGISVEDVPLGDIIDIETEFTNEYFFDQERQATGPPGDGDYRGFSDAGISLAVGAIPSNWPSVPLAEDPPPLTTAYRGTIIKHIFEVHYDSDPPGIGAQHALRIVVKNDASRNYFTILEIEQPEGVVVFSRTSSSANIHGAGSLIGVGDPLGPSLSNTVTVWEWTLAPGFTLDGSTQLKVNIGYDSP